MATMENMENLENMEEVQEKTFEQIVEELKDNRFFQHKEEIEKICYEEGVDIGVALAMYRDRMGWTGEDVTKEMQEFDSYVGNSNQAEQTKKIFDL